MNTKIRIQISNLLNERFKLNTDGLEDKKILVQNAFNKKEKLIVDGLQEITGLSFLKNYIDVFLINPDNSGSISFPAIVKAFDNTDKTICVITHELIHNLMWDNSEGVNWSMKIRELYKNENRKTAIHVSVHAILEALYTDILKEPQEIVNDIADSQKSPDYKRAWEIVKEEGYQIIINKLKNL